MEIRKDILWRVYLSFLGIALLGACVLGKVIYIQKVQGAFWKNMSDSMHLVNRPIEPDRGTIYSENGNMLSTSIPVFNVYVDFGADGLRAKNGMRFKDNVDSLSMSLASLFNDQSAAEYKKELQLAYKNEERYYSLKKKINFTEYKALREFPLVRQGRNKSGFIIDAVDRRINPYVLLANRTIGLSRADRKQNVGLEFTYDSILRGTFGQRLMRYAAGAYIPVEDGELDAVNGKDIVTTLDTYMQDVAEHALMRMLDSNNSPHGSVIVMETATGKIKAIANLGVQQDGSYIEDYNYGIGKATEPGSIFKLATLLSLLEDGYVNTNTMVDCGNGIATFSGLKIKDSHLGTGIINVKKAFYTSSNVAFAKLATQFYQSNPKQFTDHLNKFRLDQISGIDIVAASGRPYIKTKEKNRSWSATTIPFMAHGYEELVTPLNMLMLYNAVANNGKMMKPYLVNSIQQYGVDVKTIQPVVLVDRIASDETLRQARECMDAVVDSLHGTAHKVVYDPLYRIAGKTGTAVSAQGNQGYKKGGKIYQASFIGYFPADAPKYSMSVVIQNSRESKLVYGADVAGKVFKEISDRIYGHFINNTKYAGNTYSDSTINFALGTSNDINEISKFLQLTRRNEIPDAFWQALQVYQKNATVAKPAEQNAGKNTLPSVVGMGLKDALYMLENKGLIVNFSGRGKVLSQSMQPGIKINKGQKIELVLN